MDANMFAVLGYDSMFIMADAIDRRRFHRCGGDYWQR